MIWFMKIILLLCFIMAPLAHAEIYRWVDRDGNVIFSDESKSGAEQIELNPATVYTPEQSNLTPESPNQSEKTTPADLAAYQLKIISPANNEAIWANDGNVTINVLIEPALDVEAGHSLSVTVNGETVTASQGSSSVQFSNLSRGSYSASAAVINNAGTTLSVSPVIEFHVHHTAIGNR